MSIDIKKWFGDVTPAQVASLQNEVNEAMWADFGRRVHERMHHERFERQLVLALMAADGDPKPQATIIAKIRAFLMTGALS